MSLPPSREDHPSLPVLPLCRLHPLSRPSLKPSPRLFLRPCRFCLTIHPLFDRHPRRYHPSPQMHTYTHTYIHTRARIHAHKISHPRLIVSVFLSLSPSPERLSRASESPKERQNRGLSDWIVSSIYTTFGSPGATLSPPRSLVLVSAEPTRSIYVTISRNGAF